MDILFFTILAGIIVLAGWVLRNETKNQEINVWNIVYVLLIMYCALSLMLLSSVVYFNWNLL